LLQSKKISVDDTFYSLPNVQTTFPQVGPGVDKVTIRNLLQHRSGMTNKPDLMFGDNNTHGDLFVWARTYLAEQNVKEADRGSTYLYANSNYTILQAIVGCVTSPANAVKDNYAQWVADNLLRPYGISTNSFNPKPDPRDTATLSYAKPSSQLPGVYWDLGDGVGAGSWIASANDLASYLLFTINGQYVDDLGGMLAGEMGWMKYEGVYGQYFQHVGGLGSRVADGETYGTSTLIAIFPGRIGLVLFSNAESVGIFDIARYVYEVNIPKPAVVPMTV
jgi:CubicO group peptidase (beta-lactamase class C family)